MADRTYTTDLSGLRDEVLGALAELRKEMQKMNLGGFGPDAKNQIFDRLMAQLDLYASQLKENDVDITGTPLTPSPGGKDCLGNGEHPGIECCCENCNHYLTCFPDDNNKGE